MEELVIVGNGMAGVACLEQILKHAPKFNITVFGDETHANYNRILLSSVLAGERAADDITINSLEWYQQNNIGLRLGVRVIDVDPVRRIVKGDDRSVTSYDKLLLATGSHAFLPPISGLDKENVFTFRNLDDTRAILDAAGPGVKAVVIGGGLLGLEAARGLQAQGCDVTVIHLLETLMNLQLDLTGGAYLQQKMEQIGVRVLTSRVTQRLLGNGKVEGLEFANGELLEADLVVIAAGIRPNVDLGSKAGLQINRGIVVNDYMETSDPRIFAVGNASSTTARSSGWWRRCSNKGKCWQPRSRATRSRPLLAGHLRPSSRSWCRRFLRRRLPGGRRHRSRALRRSHARSLQEASGQR